MVYWPLEDTNQDDPIGLRICADNRRAIWEADEVHIWFDTNSEGSIFDLGMYFAFLMIQKKKLIVINREHLFKTSQKSFNNVMLALEKASK